MRRVNKSKREFSIPSTINTLIGGTTFASPRTEPLPFCFAAAEDASLLLSAVIRFVARRFGVDVPSVGEVTGDECFRVSSLVLLVTGDTGRAEGC